VLFGSWTSSGTGPAKVVEGTATITSVSAVVEELVNAKKVVIVPGYGLAVAAAQYAVAELTKLLRANNVRSMWAAVTAAAAAFCAASSHA
jgi:NAD/NADP transhydrogenase beta subunit